MLFFFTTGQAPGSPFVWNVLAPLATKETCLKTKLALVKPFQAPPSQAHLGSSVPPPRYTCPGNDTLCPPLGVGHPQDRPGDFFTIPVLSTVGVYSRYSIHAYLPHLSLLPDLTDSFKYYSPLMKTKKHPLKEYCWLVKDRPSWAQFRAKLLNFWLLHIYNNVGPKSGLCSKEFE